MIGGKQEGAMKLFIDSGNLKEIESLVPLGIIDGVANLLGDVFWGIGGWLRSFQTGYLRSYVLFLALAAIGTSLSELKHSVAVFPLPEASPAVVPLFSLKL